MPFYKKAGRFICQSMVMIGLIYFFNADSNMHFVFTLNAWNLWLIGSWLSQLVLVNQKQFFLHNRSLPTRGMTKLKNEEITTINPQNQSLFNHRKQRLSQELFYLELHDDQWGLVINIGMSLVYGLFGPIILVINYLKHRYLAHRG